MEKTSNNSSKFRSASFANIGGIPLNPEDLFATSSKGWCTRTLKVIFKVVWWSFHLDVDTIYFSGIKGEKEDSPKLRYIFDLNHLVPLGQWSSLKLSVVGASFKFL